MSLYIVLSSKKIKTYFKIKEIIKSFIMKESVGNVNVYVQGKEI